MENKANEEGQKLLKIFIFIVAIGVLLVSAFLVAAGVLLLTLH